jgi:hypothetical protein
MCFCRHDCNLREILQGDLTHKIVANVISLDFPNAHCNCHPRTVCLYNGKCQQKIVVYCAICDTTGMSQQTVKNRMAKHKQDTRQLFLKGKHSDSFAAHFDQLIPEEGTESKEVKKPYQVQTRNSLARQPTCYHQNLWNKRIQTLCKRTPGNLETHPIHTTPCHQQVHQNLWSMLPQPGIP